MADHRDVQRMERFLREWLVARGVHAVADRGDAFVAIGEIEEQDDRTWRGRGHFRALDGAVGCYTGTLQLVNITALARGLLDEKVVS